MEQQLTPCAERLVVPTVRRVLTIGIPAEDAAEETRVPLTPQGVEILVAQGHKVLFQRGAGASARFADERYAMAGADVVADEAQVFNADVILKVAPPTSAQVALMRKAQTVVCFASRHSRDRGVYLALSEKKATMVAVDVMNDPDAIGPVLTRSLGEMEGMMAVTTAANLLECSDGGKGVIIGGVTGVPPTDIVIIGSDTAAMSAARTAIALGANVKVFDTSLSHLHELAWQMPRQVFTSVLHPQALTKALGSADVVICTRRRPAEQCFCIPTEYLSFLKRNAVVVDLDTIEGGRTDISRSTSIARPTYCQHDIIMHCLPDITVLAPHTASIAISDMVTPLISTIAQEGGVDQAARFHRNLASAVAMYQGTVTNKVLAKSSGLEYFDIKLLLI